MAWKANGKMDLPLADRAMAWDADAAEARVRKWAGGEDNMDWGKYRKAFFAYDDERSEEFGGYKLQFADVEDGKLVAVPRGIMAVAAVLQGGRGGVDLPEEVQNGIREKVSAYYAKWDEQAPWERKSVDVPEVREGRVLSEKNRQLIANAILQAKEAIDALQELLESTAVSKEEKTAVIGELTAVRSLGPDRIGGYAIVWGGRDLYGTYFAPSTDTWREFNPNPPLLYDHGFAPEIGPTPLGRVVVRKIDDIGEWVEAELDRHSEYLAAIQELIRRGKAKLGWSTGSAKHLVEVDEDGYIRRWPVVEVSLTPTPAEPRTLGVEELKAIGLEHIATIAADEAAGGEARPVSDDNNAHETKGDDKMTDEIKKEDAAVAASEVRGAYAVPAVNKTPLGDSAVKAFVHWARTGDVGAVKTAVVWNEGTEAEGGILVPEDFYAGIVEKAKEQSIIRKMGCMVIRTSRDVINIPLEGGVMDRFALTSEGSAYDETDDTPFGAGQVQVYKGTRLVKVTEEELADAALNLDEILARKFADAIAATENYFALVGTGSSQPQGVLAGGTLGKTFASASTIAAGEVMDLYYALPGPYRSRPNVAWVMADSTEKVIRKIQATSSAGEFLFQVTPAGVIDPNSLLGKPVFTCSAMPTIAASAKTIVIGDWSKFILVERSGLVVQRNPYLYPGHVGFFAHIRFGMLVGQAEAFQYGQHPTA